jgi:hypothetical protein
LILSGGHHEEQSGDRDDVSTHIMTPVVVSAVVVIAFSGKLLGDEPWWM